MESPTSEREITAAGRMMRCSERFSVRQAARIRFVGALDAYTVGDAAARINALLEGHPREVIVDLADLEQMDSMGTRTLITLYKRVTANGGAIRFINVGEQPLMVLDVLGLKAAFGL